MERKVRTMAAKKNCAKLMKSANDSAKKSAREFKAA